MKTAKQATNLQQPKRILLNKDAEFFTFLRNTNAFSLAIGVVLGQSVSKLVSSIVNDLVMPIVGIVTPSGSWREIQIVIRGSVFGVGNFLGTVMDFSIVAIIVFVIAKKILRLDDIPKK